MQSKAYWALFLTQYHQIIRKPLNKVMIFFWGGLNPPPPPLDPPLQCWSKATAPPKAAPRCAALQNSANVALRGGSKRPVKILFFGMLIMHGGEFFTSGYRDWPQSNPVKHKLFPASISRHCAAQRGVWWGRTLMLSQRCRRLTSIRPTKRCAAMWKVLFFWMLIIRRVFLRHVTLLANIVTGHTATPKKRGARHGAAWSGAARRSLQLHPSPYTL